MLPDPGGLPIGRSLLTTALVYASVALFAAGPLVGERTIEKSGWDRSCAALVTSGLEHQRPEAPAIPALDCGSLIAPLFGPDGAAWCARYGGEIQIPFADVLADQRRRLEDLNQRRLSYAASKAGTRCACAVTTTLEERRVAFALYAGSFRLITPPSVRNLAAELEVALADPRCAMKEGLTP